MNVKQLSVFIENKSGRLAEITRVLSDQGLNIRALSIADTSDFGILRLIIDDPDRGLTALKAAGCAVSVTEVLAVAMEDHPGGLALVLEALRAASVSIEYMYAFLGKAEGRAVVVFRTEAPAEAASALTAAGVAVLSPEVFA